MADSTAIPTDGPTHEPGIGHANEEANLGQNSQGQTKNNPVNNVTATRPSYSAVTNANTPNPKRHFSEYLRNRSRLENDRITMDGKPALFSSHAAPYLIGIPFDPAYVDKEELSDVAHAFYPGPTCEAIYFSTSTFYIAFASEEDRVEALYKPMPFKDTSLEVFPVIRSMGTRLTIRSDYITVSNAFARRDALEEVFGQYGKIIHQGNYRDTRFNQLRAYTQFTIELHENATEDLEIPRVANIGGSNALFSWNGVPFCYRCGQGDHLKARCPQSHDYTVWNQQPLKTPLKARAFPSKTAPLRPTQSGTTMKQASSSVTPSTGKGKISGEGFTTGQPGRKHSRRGNPTSGRSVTAPASSSDSDQRSFQKKGPAHGSKESLTVHHSPLIVKENSSRVTDENLSSSSVSQILGQQSEGTGAGTAAPAPPSNKGSNAVEPVGEKIDLTTSVGSGPASASGETSVLQKKASNEFFEESKLVHNSVSIGRENSSSVTDKNSSLSVPQNLGQHSGGAAADAAAAPIAATTPAAAALSCLGPNAVVSKEVITEVTAPPTAVKQQEGVSPSPLTAPSKPSEPQEKEDYEGDYEENDESADDESEDDGPMGMDGLEEYDPDVARKDAEFNEDELMELANPDISPERRKALNDLRDRRRKQAQRKQKQDKKKREKMGNPGSKGRGPSNQVNGTRKSPRK